MSFAMGADLGGTKLSVVLTSEGGVPIHEIWMPHSFGTLDDLVAAFEQATHTCRTVAASHGQAVDRMGLSLAAWMNRSRDHVILGANLGLSGIDLKELLQARLGFESIVIENDGDATAWGEYRFGAAEKSSSMALISLGTGVGGGIVHEGRLLRGSTGLGGELGHIRITPEGQPCICGASGCLELLASGRSLDIAATNLRESGQSHWLVANRPTGTLTARDLTAAARGGDQAAINAFDKAASAIAAAIAILIPILDPEVVVVGGSVVAGAGDILIPRIRAHQEALNTLGAVRKPQTIAQATLGPIAAAIGAADAAR